MIFRLDWTSKDIEAEIALDGSKSISNRALILHALADHDFPIHHISQSEDTQTLRLLLASENDVLDVGPAGTTFRFLTAYLNTQSERKILTGSDRMKQRPIGPLVSALRQIGADIEYLENEGYPPLAISPSSRFGENHHVQIEANVSSQFITALLLIAPVLPKGLTINLLGDLVSPSYLQMTIRIMQSFGVKVDWSGQSIHIAPQKIGIDEFLVEADWSGASYHYLVAALANSAKIHLVGLHQNSLQGDAAMQTLMDHLGVQTTPTEKGMLIEKVEFDHMKSIQHDFTSCPDIAQTMAVACGALGVQGHFTGVQTLSIKETDRIDALRQELKKIGCIVQAPEVKQPAVMSISGKASWNSPVVFHTYHDHRMAMAFAPLSLIQPVDIEDPKVVGKSYVSYWDHLTQMGASISLVG